MHLTDIAARKRKSSIGILTVVLFLGTPIVALQQTMQFQSAATTVQFNIPAQPMDRALKEFASQSRLQLIFATDDIASGTLAHAVLGTYRPEAALAQLLSESCLVYKFVNTNTVSVGASHRPCR